MQGPPYFKIEPRANQPLSVKGFANGLRRIANALRFMKCEGGDVVYSGHGVPTIRPFGGRNLEHELDKYLANKLPWAPRIVKTPGAWQLMIKNCHYTRGPYTFILNDLNFWLIPPDGEGVYFVGIKIDMLTGEVYGQLLIDKNVNEVIKRTDIDDRYFHKLLYSIAYKEEVEGETEEESEPDGWNFVNTTYRLMPDLGAYV